MIDEADLAVLRTARQMKRLQNVIGSKQNEAPLVKALSAQLQSLMERLVEDISKLDANREASIDG